MDALGAQDGRAARRTAKSCGSGAPTLAPSWRRCSSIAPMTGARKPGPREEHEGNRKTIARGMPEMFGLPVVTMLVCFHSSHTRLRVRPAPGIPCALFDLRGWLLNDSGAFVPRDRGGVSWREPNAAIRSQGKPDLIGASVFLANDLLAKKNG